MKIRTFKYFSPIGLLTLTACGGGGGGVSTGPGGGSSSTIVGGAVVKGPLSNALVGLDYDGDGVVDSSTVRTGADGSYSITTTSSTYTVIAVADETTIDTSSGTILSGITLKAPQGASVVTPSTTLIEEAGITKEQVAEVLGLPDGVDPLSFNPYADGVNQSDALAVEKASQQIMSVVNAFAGAAEGAGASEAEAFEAALNSVVEVVKVKATNLSDTNASEADKTLDLTNAADLALVKAEVVTKVANDTSADTTAFDALADDTVTAVKNVNDKIATVNDLSSEEAKNTFSTTQVLADQTKQAAEAEVQSAGSGSIDFTDTTKVEAAAANKAPTDITLSKSEIAENASSLVIGTLSTIDSDQTSGVAHTYKIAELAGTDYAAFSINATTGELSFVEQPDFETKSSYSITILSTDEGGKTLSKSFTISVTDVDEAPILTDPADGSVTEDGPSSTITGSLSGSDPEGASLRFSVENETSTDGEFVIDGEYGTLTLNESTGVYSYTLNNGASNVQALNASQSVVDRFSVNVSDGNNVSNSKELTFTIEGAADAPTDLLLDGDSINENIGNLIAVGTLSVSDTDASDTHSYVLLNQGLDEDKFEIVGTTLNYIGTGENYEAGSTTLTVAVEASDGVFSVQKFFTITVGDVNDAPQWNSNVSPLPADEDAPFSFDLTTISSDEDNDTLSYTLISGPDWLQANGATLSGTPVNADVGTETVLVQVSDGSETATKFLQVRVANTDDPSVVDGEYTGSVTEGDIGDAVVSATGSLSIVDVDADDTPSFADVSLAAGDNEYGTFSLSGGTWTYELDQSAVQDLDPGDEVKDTYTFVATDETAQKITVTITGTADDPTLTVDASGSVTEGDIGDAVVSATGSLSIADVDENDTPSFEDVSSAAGDNEYGTFSLSGGTWTYVLDQSAVQDLGADNEVTDTYTFAATDGTEQEITVTITGTNDLPTITTSETSYSVSNNIAGGAVGEFAATDLEDSASEIVFSLAENVGDNSNFEFDGSLLKFKDSVTTSYSDKSEYNVTITATDRAGGTDTLGLTVNVTQIDVAPTIENIAATANKAVLIAGDKVTFATRMSEEIEATDAEFSLTLNTDAVVTMRRDSTDATLFTGEYVVASGDQDTAALAVSSYTAGSVEDAGGNALDTSETEYTISETDIVIDTTVPTAEIANTGHAYNASSGVLTLAASDLLTLGVTAGADVTSQVDITKLSWDVNQSGNSLETFTADDVSSVVVTDSETLTITFTEAKRSDLAGTSNFGGTSSNADGLDIEAGFLSDNAGNASEQVALDNAEVAMSDTTGPSISGFTVTPSSEGILGTGDTIVYTATASEAMRVGTTMQITLSNDATVTLSVDADAPTTLTGTYTIQSGDSDDQDLTISQYTAQTAVDISGNALSTATAIGNISGSDTQGIVVDTQAPTATALYEPSSDSLRLLFNEEISNQDDVVNALRALDIVDVSATASWVSSGENVVVTTNSDLSGDSLVINLSIEDLAGNTRDYEEIPLAIFSIL